MHAETLNRIDASRQLKRKASTHRINPKGRRRRQDLANVGDGHYINDGLRVQEKLQRLVYAVKKSLRVPNSRSEKSLDQ